MRWSKWHDALALRWTRWQRREPGDGFSITRHLELYDA